jgi:hypothetical protein
MRRTAAIVLMAIGIGGGAFVAKKKLQPVIDVTFDLEPSTSDLVADLIPDWQLRVPFYRKPWFGLCPELERIP